MDSSKKVISGYKLEKEIIRGSFGVLYSATAQNSQRCLVHKIQNVLYSTKLEEKIGKMKQLSKCQHLLNIWDFFFHPEKSKLFVVMQECDNTTLQDYIDNQRRQVTDETLCMMSDINQGLIYLHKNDVIHGNLTPYHVLIFTVQNTIHCKIGNLLENQLNRRKVMENSLYQAPEVLEWRPATWMSDVFSLGLVFLALLGQYGVQERESILWVLRSGQDAGPVFDDIIPDNADLVKMLDKMLQWEPKNRLSAATINKKYLRYLVKNKNKSLEDIGDLALKPVEDCEQFDAVDVTHEKEAAVRSKWFLSEHRLQSFNRWPKEDRLKRLTPVRMVEAGFYATGHGDEVRCAICRIRLAHWEQDDDPWEEHRKGNAQCALVIQKIGWTRGKGVPSETRSADGSFAKEPSYEILEEIGAGGFGSVHKVRMLETGETVARKRIKVRQMNPETALRELHIAHELLPHPNIISMHDAFLTIMKETPIYIKYSVTIFMEYCKEGNLNDFMVGRLPSLDVSMGFMMDIARGVEHLHKSKIMHRDLKPDNILVFRDPSRFYCKVTDFNVSSFFSDDKGLKSNMPRHPFQAPEVLDLPGKYSTERDVFSVGAICYALAALEVEDEILVPLIENYGIATAVLRNKERSIYNIIESVCGGNEDLATVVTSMLKQDPGKRPTIKKVSKQLGEICQKENIFVINFSSLGDDGEETKQKRFQPAREGRRGYSSAPEPSSGGRIHKRH